MSTSQRLPSAIEGPLGVVSLIVGILGAVLGYIFVVLGVTMYFDLNSITISNTQSLIIVATGVVAIVLAYAGWRGFMRFAY
jgi:glycopeptide antibiotics resistance protein